MKFNQVCKHKKIVLEKRGKKKWRKIWKNCIFKVKNGNRIIEKHYVFKDLALLIVKNNLPMHLVESQWIKRFSWHLCQKFIFPFKEQSSRIFLPKLVEKTNQLYILPVLAYYYSITTTFDLWMSKNASNIFALVINYLGANWQPKRIAIKFFEASNTFGHALAKDLTKLLSKYDLQKIYHYLY